MIGDKFILSPKTSAFLFYQSVSHIFEMVYDKPLPFINLVNFDESVFTKLLLMPSVMS